MSREFFKNFSFILVGLIFASCGNADNFKKDLVEVEIDSNAILPTLNGDSLILLPDTSFVSVVENVEYQVVLYDSTCDGKLSIVNEKDSFPGVYTFRGNGFRDMPHGDLVGRPSGMEVEWVFETKEVYGNTKSTSWGGGLGWTGQPLVVSWNRETADSMKVVINENDSSSDISEVIFGSLSGLIYFIDFVTGKPTRKAIDTGNPIKGTPMIDPDLNGNLLVGQGYPNKSQLGFRVYNLFTNRLLKFFPGLDKLAGRRWGAFDSSPIKVGGFYFWPGENGVVYKFRFIDDSLVMHSKLKYSAGKTSNHGVESSLAVYKNYGYFGDNLGNIICINLETLRPVWHFKNYDDTDASIVLEVEEGNPYIYSGCEVDKQGFKGKSNFIKLNALNGEMIWSNGIECYSVRRNGKIYNGGMLSTPLIGQHNANDLIYTVFSQTDKDYTGELIAFNKKSGDVIFKTKLNEYSWSSPVAFYNETGDAFIFIGDVKGYLYLIDGQTGEIIFSKLMGLNFEASPLVYKNRIIIGSRGRKIYKIKLV